MQDSAGNGSLPVTLRPVVIPDDDDFLQTLYLSVRDDLRGLFPDEDQQRQLVQMQYSGQKLTYAAEYPNATHEVVMLGDRAVGRLIVDRRLDRIHGVDLAVLPEYRNHGVGTKVLLGLIDECSERGLPFTLSVLKTNGAAIRLYERLGVRVDGDEGTHFSMRIVPVSIK